MTKRLELLGLVCLVSSLITAGCGAAPEPTLQPATPFAASPAPRATSAASNPTPQASNEICREVTPPQFLTQLVLAADAAGADYTPVGITTEFSPDQRIFHAIVTLANAPPSRIMARWFLLESPGYASNSKIQEKEVSTQGSRNVDFTLESNNPSWPPGSYCVEIYVDGLLAASSRFQVVGAGSNQPSNPVIKVVLAEGTNPQTFEPVNPTTSFKKVAPLIHAAVQIKDAGPKTDFVARWYPPGQEPLEFKLTTGGTRWLDFQLTPAPDGFPGGEYKVEILVNGQLVETLTFNVE